MEDLTDNSKYSLGEKRCGVVRDSHEEIDVIEVREACAALIDKMERLKRKSDDPEVIRLTALAMTNFETGQMFAVKAYYNNDKL